MTPNEIAAIEANAVRAVAKKINSEYQAAKARADTEPDPHRATLRRYYADGINTALLVALSEAERLEHR